MSYPAVAPAPAPTFGYGTFMARPGPLGLLVRRRRAELGLTQWGLSDLTARSGVRVPQTVITRLETGATQRMHNIGYLNALRDALGYRSNREFILIAYGPDALQDEEDAAALPDMELLVRVMVGTFDLDDAEEASLRRSVEHVRDTWTARGPSPEERIAAFAREIAAHRTRNPVTLNS